MKPENHSEYRVWGGRARRVGGCACCGRRGVLHSRGLIDGCYRRRHRDGTLDQFPVRRVLNGDPQCAHVYADGVRCDHDRGRYADGRFRSPYCGMHRNRIYQGLDMDAPKHMPGQRDRMIYG